MTKEFDPMAVSGADHGDDIEVEISSGGATVKTTFGAMKRASENGIAKAELRAFIERIERLQEEKDAIAEDIKQVYGELKGVGFSPKIVKKVVAIRKKDEREWREEDMILDTYLAALGMLRSDGE